MRVGRTPFGADGRLFFLVLQETWWVTFCRFQHVPKSKILCAADVIELYFTRGVYSVFPVSFFMDLLQNSVLFP